MRTHGKAFTLLELLIVIGIIMILAGMLMYGLEHARVVARAKSSQAVVNLLGAGCEAYAADYRDYPMPNPTYIGNTGDTLGTVLNGLSDYGTGPNWNKERAYNVGLVFLLTTPRTPVYIDIQKAWFKLLDDSAKGRTGPGGRALYRVVDGFGRDIFVDRYYRSTPTSQYYSLPLSYIRLVSIGADGDCGTVGSPEAKDNVEVYLKR